MGWPSLEEVATNRAPVRRVIPDGARYEWAKVFNKVLKDIATFNDERAWLELFMLPQAILGGEQVTRERAGKPWTKRMAGDIAKRCQKWQKHGGKTGALAQKCCSR